ncbi:MAG: hypothetical protein K9H48_21715 [Melioribacteraceae bacterium]|nr:hypothetical protein [Candidatus Omnitrophota bacterium]MCF8357068.1 hypothetical protein [Melioribacteraceae bacterium]
MEFRDLREKAERIIEGTKEWVKKKNLLDSSKKLEEVEDLVKDLNKIATNDVQVKAVSRLRDQLEYLAEDIDEILSKREAGKQGDGNMAFKCNWNDKHYKEVCSKEAYEFNINEGRAWCSSPQCRCREYLGSELTLDNYPCYESIALKEMHYGAGWDHKSGINKPRHIHNGRENKIAVLTTRPPNTEEKDRLIVGCLYIDKIQDDPGAETKLYTDKKKSIEVDYDNVKVKFWDYYKNAGNEELILWASGLFRYITDETVLNILKGIGEKYKNSGKDTKKIIDLIKYYEEVIQSKK